ncbi:hypothetical protein ACFO25_12405 [Paenactinomyces guangxiensis]|nr:hypothetical protein [Paenactinomyces guangxiensis]
MNDKITAINPHGFDQMLWILVTFHVVAIFQHTGRRLTIDSIA